jgi:hypothetical protein
MDKDLGGIHARLMGNRLAGVLGRAGQLEGLGAVGCQQERLRQHTTGHTGGSWWMS